MQVFVPYEEPYLTAKYLDKRRLNKQIIEGYQILNAINGGKAYRNHPITKMYSNSKDWLRLYLLSLEAYMEGDLILSKYYSNEACKVKPWWINSILCDQHKRRLYTKDPIYYKIFEDYGQSYNNYYIVDGDLLIYNNGLIGKTNYFNFCNKIYSK